ncbi:MAG: YggU family protein [Candidatus Bathyarchaeota archaeon]|nr:MAG: YggU family protein [Candidatus Bathyarchaeota archaeon]
MKLKKTAQGIVLDVYVKPNSKEFQTKIEEDRLLVFCREAPVKGRVNRELIKELSKLLKRRVEILSGITARQKRVLIRDSEANEVRQVLAARER